MAEKHFDHEDPFEFVGVVMDTPADQEYWDGMAKTFIEEYVRMGWNSEEIFELFKDPFYRASHEILKKHGEPYVRNLIAEVRNG